MKCLFPDVFQPISVSRVVWHFLVGFYFLYCMFLSGIQTQVYDNLYGQLPSIANRDNNQISGFSFLIALQYRNSYKNKKWQFVRFFMKVADSSTLYLQRKLWNNVIVLHVVIKLIHLQFAHSRNLEAVKWTAICAISHCQALMPVW